MIFWIFSPLFILLLIEGNQGFQSDDTAAEFSVPILSSFTEEEPTFRNARHFFRARYPLDRGVHYAWQNPVRTAPTLPPKGSAPDYPVSSTETPVTTTTKKINWWEEREGYSSGRDRNPRPNFPLYTSTKAPFTTEEYENGNWQKRPSSERPPSTNGRDSPNGNRGTNNGRVPSQRPNKCEAGFRRSIEDGQCWPLGMQGPCNENMAFYSNPNDINAEYGVCDCYQNFNRPIVYHQETDKCYFIFQQAFCQPGEWLIIDSDPGNTPTPTCDTNRCISWAEGVAPGWDWTKNGRELDTRGLVAIIKEALCVTLQWECIRESQDGRERLTSLLRDEQDESRPKQDVILKFDGPNLACRRDSSIEFPIFPPNTLRDNKNDVQCKSGLYNKWRSQNKCNETQT